MNKKNPSLTWKEYLLHSLLLVTGAAAFGVYRWLTYENTANFANFMRRDAQAPSPDQSITISIDESIKK